MKKITYSAIQISFSCQSLAHLRFCWPIKISYPNFEYLTLLLLLMFRRLAYQPTEITPKSICFSNKWPMGKKVYKFNMSQNSSASFILKWWSEIGYATTDRTAGKMSAFSYCAWDTTDYNIIIRIFRTNHASIWLRTKHMFLNYLIFER